MISFIIIKMVNIVIVDKYGKCTKKCVKDFDIKNIYKYSSLKKETKHFCKRHTWNTEDGNISIYCKSKGNAGTENKYELPRPLDEKLYFGKIVLIMHSDENLETDNAVDLELEYWEKVYNELMGGEESLGDEEFSSEEEIPDELKTKNGYMKDGFVVDDDEIEYDDSSEMNDDDKLDDEYDYDEEDEEDEDDESYEGEEGEEGEENEEEEEEDSDYEESEEDIGSELETEESSEEEEEIDENDM
jgi:hypothetical protein